MGAPTLRDDALDKKRLDFVGDVVKLFEDLAGTGAVLRGRGEDVESNLARRNGVRGSPWCSGGPHRPGEIS
jgi:hypothetical protein